MLMYSIAVGEEDLTVNKLVEMTEERTMSLVPMETTTATQQQLLQVQPNGPVGASEGVGLHEDDNSSEDDS